MLKLLPCVAALCATPALVNAQDTASGIEFRLGVGPSVEPGYFGDADLDAGVGVKFDLERLQFGGRTVGGDKSLGLGFGPSFRIVDGREAGAFDELAGLDDLDPSLEVGGGIEFIGQNYDVFAKVRYGVVGHESFVAELGGDYFFQPTQQLTLSAGPRVLLGDDDYAQTYFGVQGAASLTDFTAQGGLMSAGAEIEATYAINEDWEVVGTINYDQLLEDAADSPISAANDQVSGSIVLTRRITLGF